MIPEKKLDFWIQNNYNVILRGKHGVGKTACIKEAFNRNNLNWLYFSASTMDPWVDFIGVPKEKEENGKSYLELVRPRAFAEDEVQAIFFDEYNRSHSKIRNAVMELIQFKSINGKKFNNLKIVWAAINPEDNTEDEELKYNVEPVDPAQLDRFHVIYDVAYVLDKKYFSNKYGDKIAKAAHSWWNSLDEKVKNKISPRRMDYAMDFFSKKGDLRDVLPREANVSKLVTEIEHGTYKEQLENVVASGNTESMKEFISNENNFYNCIKYITANEKYLELFLPLLGTEKLSKLMAKDIKVLSHVTTKIDIYQDIIKDIIVANLNNKLVKTLKSHYNTIIANSKNKTIAKTDKDITITDITIAETDKDIITQVNSSIMSTQISNTFQIQKNIIKSAKLSTEFGKILKLNAPFSNFIPSLRAEQIILSSSAKPANSSLGTVDAYFTTQEKMKAYRGLMGTIASQLPLEEYKEIAKFIVYQIGKMQHGTLNNYKKGSKLLYFKDFVSFVFSKLIEAQEASNDPKSTVYQECETLLLDLFSNNKLMDVTGFATSIQAVEEEESSEEL